MSAASIRPLAEADHDVWLALWRGYQAFYKVELGPVVEAATWSRLLDPSEPVHGAVAVEGARAIGLVHWICQPLLLDGRRLRLPAGPVRRVRTARGPAPGAD